MRSFTGRKKEEETKASAKIFNFDVM